MKVTKRTTIIPELSDTVRDLMDALGKVGEGTQLAFVHHSGSGGDYVSIELTEWP